MTAVPHIVEAVGISSESGRKITTKQTLVIVL